MSPTNRGPWAPENVFGAGFTNFVRGASTVVDNIFNSGAVQGFPRSSGGRNWVNSGNYAGPGYMDTSTIKRGRVGGGNAGASTAEQWPASLRGPGSVLGGRPVPLVTGTRDGVNPDRIRSDQYLAAMGTQAPQYPYFPQTPQGQFDRYFGGSPEMDQYFGAASRGAGAPKTLQEMSALAALSKAPTTSPLSTYYRAQSAAGRGNMDTIANALTQNMSGIEAENMRKWANANPMLADRLYNKKFPGGFTPPQAAPAALGAVPTPGSAADPAIFSGAGQVLDFNINPVAAPPGTQGVEPTSAVKYLQQAYTQPEPATAPEKVNALLNKWGIAPGQRFTMIGN